MLEKGLNVFKIRTKNIELIKEDFDLLPLSYKFFLKCFDGINLDFVKIDNDLIQFSYVKFKKTINDVEYENSLAYLYDVNEIKKEIFLYKKMQENYHALGFIKIGYFDISDSLLLKIKDENSGEIWKLNGDWGVPLPYKEKLSENIFEFSSYLEKDIIKMNLKVRDVDLKDIVRRYNSENWVLIKDIL